MQIFFALKGRLFIDFKDHTKLVKLHEVKFDTNLYENETACREFIKTIACYLFDEDVRKKLTRVNLIAILINGTTDRTVKEQEVLYVMFVNPDTNKPTFVYFEVLEIDDFGQTALRMMAAIKHCFKENKFTELWDKLLYLPAVSASLNSGKDFGVITQFQEKYQ